MYIIKNMEEDEEGQGAEKPQVGGDGEEFVGICLEAHG